MKKCFLLIFVLFSLICNSQDYKPSSQSNQSLDFENFLSGVKYAYVVLNEGMIQDIDRYPNMGTALAIKGLSSYLSEIGFIDVKYGLASNTPTYPSICQLTTILPQWSYSNGYYREISLCFYSCIGDKFIFEATRNIPVNEYVDLKKWFHNTFKKMYGKNKPNFNENSSISLPNEMTELTESKFKDELIKNGSDEIEGIYEATLSPSNKSKYKIGIKKTGDAYNIVYFSGALNYIDWKEGEIKAKLFSTSTSALFKADWVLGNKKINKDGYASFEKGLMNFIMPEKENILFIKLFPTSTDNVSSKTGIKVSGSGFGLSSNGFIATNYHVINGAKEIKVRGVKGDFTKSFNAKVILEDKNNDLAIIQIDDTEFSTLGIIPYKIIGKPKDVGSSVYIMGYPLRASMGDEIKLTNGIVSSNSGFQGDITAYQISAAVQPGNSGGPLFDENGNVIGIVNAKHSLAENASYAIKASYLLNIIELIPSFPKLQNTSLVSGKTLTEQVKTLKKFTYIIEVN